MPNDVIERIHLLAQKDKKVLIYQDRHGNYEDMTQYNFPDNNDDTLYSMYPQTVMKTEMRRI